MARDPKEAAPARTACVPEEHVAKVGRLSESLVSAAVKVSGLPPKLDSCLQVWNMAYYSGLVCIAPYMNVYYKRLDITERQIGVLAALSPWVNASSGDRIYPLHAFVVVTVLSLTDSARCVSRSQVLLQELHGLPLLITHTGTSLS